MTDISASRAEGPILALRRAVLAQLAADPALLSLLGGARIYDEPPRAADGVYAVFGDVRLADWSTGTDQGHLQDFSVVVWSKPGGARAGLAAAARIATLLHEAELPLDGFRLVALRQTGTEARRDQKANLARIAVQLRAVTEVVAAGA